MKFQFVKRTKPSQGPIRSLIDVYQRRLNAMVNCEVFEQRPKARKSKGCADDYDLDLKAGDFLVVLDERGSQLTSKRLASLFEQWFSDPRINTVKFMVGGPYGFDEGWRQRADFCWCLSSGTLPTELAWLLLWEQVYRGMTIMKGLPYHHA